MNLLGDLTMKPKKNRARSYDIVQKELANQLTEDMGLLDFSIRKGRSDKEILFFADMVKKDINSLKKVV